MSELIQNTVKIIEEFNSDVKTDLQTKGIDNSRKASDSIRIVIDQNNNKIQSVGVDYLYYLDKGRGPGKFPPPNVIEDWTRTKPVEIDPFLVGRKIAREGTDIFRDPRRGIMLDEKRQKVMQLLKQNAPKWAKQDLLIQMKGVNKI